MDPLEFLTRAGYPVTERSDGLFDIQNVGSALTPVQVFDVWLSVKSWPLSIPRVGPPINPHS